MCSVLYRVMGKPVPFAVIMAVCVPTEHPAATQQPVLPARQVWCGVGETGLRWSALSEGVGFQTSH